MAKYIVHLGYPKTGTTYLQRKLFLQLKDEFKLITPEFENCGINIRRVKYKLQNGIVPKRLKQAILGNSLLISLEGLLFDPMRNVSKGDFSPMSFVKALEALYELGEEYNPNDVAVVLYLRRQDSLIHSLYAESKIFHFDRCEKLNTFEKYVESVLLEDSFSTDPGYYYNFNHTLSEILERFSESQLHVRFFEDLERDIEKETAFWSGLCDYNFEVVYGKENARSVDASTKNTDAPNFVRYHLIGLKNNFFPGMKLPLTMSKMIKRKLVSAGSGEAQNITLNDITLHRIMSKYGKLNATATMKRYLNEDLADYYFGVNKK
ncbi:MAG: hypothetical protein HWE34_09665 [Methylocystaceae bacterium]|nr:hypothetical protein [Methylocystaceae bacterium]